MKKITLFIILISILCFSNRSDNNIENIKYNDINNEKKDNIENYENLNYNSLNEEKRQNMDFLINKIEENEIRIINILRSRYFLSTKKTSGEIFLEEIENELENKNIFGLNYIYAYSNKDNINFPMLYFIKNLNSNTNNFNIGMYLSYINKLKEKTNLFGIGILFETLLSDYNLSIVSINEYSYLKNKEYNSNLNLLSGGLKLSYNKYIGNSFYINPNVIFLYNSPISSQTNFSNTIANLNEGFNLSLGGNLKLGFEKEKNDNLYNFFIDFEVDKILKNKYNYSLEFKNNISNSSANKELHIVLSGGIGLDIFLKKEHRLKFIGNINYKDKKLYYGLTMNYELQK